MKQVKKILVLSFFLFMLNMLVSVSLASPSRTSSDYVFYQEFTSVACDGNWTTCQGTLVQNTTKGMYDSTSLMLNSLTGGADELMLKTMSWSNNTLAFSIWPVSLPYHDGGHTIMDVFSPAGAGYRMLIQNGVGSNDHYTIYNGASYATRSQLRINQWNNFTVTINSTGTTWCYQEQTSLWNCTKEGTTTSSTYGFQLSNQNVNGKHPNYDWIRMWNGSVVDEPQASNPSDTTPPNSSGCAVNNSAPIQNVTVSFSCAWSDNTALSGWRFEANDTTNGLIANTNSTFNTTWSATNQSTYYVKANQTIGSVVSAKFHANDSSNNWNVSSTITFTVNAPSGDACTPSGSWWIMTQSCTFSSAQNFPTTTAEIPSGYQLTLNAYTRFDKIIIKNGAKLVVSKNAGGQLAIA